MYRIGLDVGSTTAKIAVIDHQSCLVHSGYVRHNTQIYETVATLLSDISIDAPAVVNITGSAGIGLSECTGISFTQELIAATEVIQRLYPNVKTLIDIGGEDSKMIFFSEKRIPDIRMNGSCAGGTGAFIDQMATLLNVEVAGMNSLAENHSTVYSIASRCGVFAKTDVQNLISRKIPKEDIAISVFHAVAVQTLNTLARGYDVLPKIMFIGGPFTFLPELVKAFIRVLKISSSNILRPDHPEIIPALGAALLCKNDNPGSIKEIKKIIAEKSHYKSTTRSIRLTPLFQSKKEFRIWKKEKTPVIIKRVSITDYNGTDCFVGIDSGSTTTKIVVIGENEILFTYYRNNEGDPIKIAHAGLHQFRDEILAAKKKILIRRSIVTGYGEDLIKAAFNIDDGVVETIAHYEGAKNVNQHVSFILDIGGQDMKAIFVRDGIIHRIELNESCSSGCGSFLETFAQNLDIPIQDFAEKACNSTAPCDLGTRCTVFMNSKVKQSLRENANVEDIAAGLSYSVIKNALIKVLNVTNMDELGENISVQGGTFRNPSVRRALELLTKKPVIMTDIPELMGAYGAAIIAQKQWQNM